MSESPYAVEVESRVICGRAGTGKTEHIVQAAAELLKQGNSPSDICILASTEPACEALRIRLQEVIGSDMPLPSVTTVFEQELHILATPQACAFTGRSPRVLLQFEERLLEEDMKTSTMEPKRLRNMLRFFYRSITELEPMDHDWFYSDEEEDTYILLMGYLDFYGAYLPCEPGRYGYEFLSSSKDIQETYGLPFVLCDDYQTLTKASQCFVGALAKKQLILAGDTLCAVQTVEEFPYPQGMEEFQKENPQAELLELSDSHKSHAVTEALNLLLADDALNEKPLKNTSPAADGVFEIMPAKRPTDEFNSVLRLVEDRLSQGFSAEDIAIAVPHRLWIQNISTALSQKGITVAPATKLSVGGDLSIPDRSRTARLVASLGLVNDPYDQLTLRAWCGFGDHLANSAFFSHLLELGLELNPDDIDWEAVCGDAPLLQQEGRRVRAALESAQRIREAAYGKQGMQLLSALADADEETSDSKIPKSLAQIVGNLPGEASAAEILRAVRLHGALGKFAPDGMRIGLREDFIGLNLPCMILAGFVNGFTPPRDYFDPTVIERDKRPKILSEHMRRTYACAGKADQELYLSYFEEALLPDAESLKLKVARVRLLNGERVCEIHPSDTLRAFTGTSDSDES